MHSIAFGIRHNPQMWTAVRKLMGCDYTKINQFHALWQTDRYAEVPD